MENCFLSYLNTGAGNWHLHPSKGRWGWQDVQVETYSCHLAENASSTQTSSVWTAGPAHCTAPPPPAEGDRHHKALMQ